MFIYVKNEHYKKVELYHLNCITNVSDFIFNHLFINETNIYNLALVIISDVIIDLFSINLRK